MNRTYAIISSRTRRIVSLLESPMWLASATGFECVALVREHTLGDIVLIDRNGVEVSQ